MLCSPSGLVVDVSPLFGKPTRDLDHCIDLPHNDRHTFEFRDVLTNFELGLQKAKSYPGSFVMSQVLSYG